MSKIRKMAVPSYVLFHKWQNHGHQKTERNEKPTNRLLDSQTDRKINRKNI